MPALASLLVVVVGILSFWPGIDVGRHLQSLATASLVLGTTLAFLRRPLLVSRPRTLRLLRSSFAGNSFIRLFRSFPVRSHHELLDLRMNFVEEGLKEHGCKGLLKEMVQHARTGHV